MVRKLAVNRSADEREAKKCEAEVKAVLARYALEFHIVEVRVDGNLKSLEMKLFKKLPK